MCLLFKIFKAGFFDLASRRKPWSEVRDKSQELCRSRCFRVQTFVNLIERDSKTLVANERVAEAAFARELFVGRHRVVADANNGHTLGGILGLQLFKGPSLCGSSARRGARIKPEEDRVLAAIRERI